MMAFDKAKYDIEYTKAHIKCKRIPFNDIVEDDKELLEWLEQNGNVTQYIKQLIRDDMNRKKSDS
jgi:hypothetical protein